MVGVELEYVLVGEYSMYEGFWLMKEVIKGGSLFDVFFIVSDLMVIGVLKVLQEVGF